MLLIWVCLAKGRVNYLQMQTFCTHCLWHAWTPWTVSNSWCLLFFSIWLNLKGCNSQWRGCDIHSIIAVVSVFRQHPPFLLFLLRSGPSLSGRQYDAVWCSMALGWLSATKITRDCKRRVLFPSWLWHSIEHYNILPLHAHLCTGGTHGHPKIAHTHYGNIWQHSSGEPQYAKLRNIIKTSWNIYDWRVPSIRFFLQCAQDCLKV